MRPHLGTVSRSGATNIRRIWTCLEEATEVMGGLEHFSWERQTGFSQKKRPWGDLTAPSVPKGVPGELGKNFGQGLEVTGKGEMALP